MKTIKMSCSHALIKYLTAQKILINGTSAHNSFGVYGASNYSIFKNKPLSLDKHNEYKGVIKDKKWAPLGILNEKDLKLEYECNDFFWQKKKKVDFISLLRQGLWLYYKDHFNCLNKKKFSKEWCTYSMVLKNIENYRSKKLFYFLIHPMHYGFRFSKSSNPSKKFNILHYLTGFKKERVTNKEQNIIKKIFWKPNEFGNNERSLKKIKNYPKKVLFVYQDDFFIGSNQTLCDSKLSSLLTFLLMQEGKTSVGAFSINIKNLKHLIENYFEPSAIFFELHKDSIVSNFSNEYLSKIKFKNIINLNKKKIIDSKVYNERINKIINFNHKFDKYPNDYERHLFLCYEVIKVLKLQL